MLEGEALPKRVRYPGGECVRDQEAADDVVGDGGPVESPQGRPGDSEASTSVASSSARPVVVDKTARVPAARLAGLGGLLAFVTFNAGWITGDFAQPAAFSPANDDISGPRCANGE